MFQREAILLADFSPFSISDPENSANLGKKYNTMQRGMTNIIIMLYTERKEGSLHFNSMFC